MHKNVHIDLLKTNLSHPLIEKIYGSDALPVTYVMWKDKAISLDDLWQELKSLQKSHAPPMSNPQMPPGWLHPLPLLHHLCSPLMP